MPKEFRIYQIVIIALFLGLINLIWLKLFIKTEKNEKGEFVEMVIPFREEIVSKYILDVPFVSEAPEGRWVEPWINACEESSIAMVKFFYEGKKIVSIDEAKNYLSKLFAEEDRLFGSNKNTDSKKNLEIIRHYGNFKAFIKDNPTVEDIKEEIKEGRPVLSLHRGFDLKNKNVSFSPIRSSYHVLVVIGFDDEKKSFITHDPGDRIDGIEHLYEYETFMPSLHDYDEVRNKADGPPRVIFTRK